MQLCPRCKVHIQGKKSACPLCGGTLSDVDLKECSPWVQESAGNSPEGAFPIIHHSALTVTMFVKICIFAFIVLELMCNTLLYLFGEYLPWLAIVAFFAIFAILDVLIATYYRNNVIKLITTQAIAAIIIDFIVDYKYGFYGWSVAWMIPMTLIALAIITLAIALAHRMRFVEYIRYLLFDMLIALCQIVFLKLHMNYQVIPAIFCMLFYIIIFAGAFIFRFRELKSASARYFNI
ncbi:MAG: hypothetical protein K6G23_01080 [Lachnospiraceae bacterium]|nr:hypothetical protein [Lachnospiraceae bacterium]